MVIDLARGLVCGQTWLGSSEMVQCVWVDNKLVVDVLDVGGGLAVVVFGVKERKKGVRITVLCDSTNACIT